MIIEISDKDTILIEEIENTFTEAFKDKKILEDLKRNIFSKYFILKEKSNIIGYVNYYDLYDRFELAYIEVKEEYRHQNYGSKLLEYLINIGKDHNIENITLEVNVNNENAIKLYEKYMFIKVAIRSKYYNGVDGYLMERKMI